MSYALDLHTPVRHVATEMERADHALSVSELAATYQHPIAGDISRVKRNESLRNDREAVEWIITRALDAIKNYVTNGDGTYTLNRPFDKIRFDRKKVHRTEPPARFEDSFDPMRGRFTDNIRITIGKDSMDELRESMRAFGWLPEFPALIDERGVVLVGHRRLAVAEELDIEPEVRVIRIGAGDEADVRRFSIAIASNIGGRELTTGQRQDIAAYLYGEREWTMAKIAKALKVSHPTISRDLRVVQREQPPDFESRGGRPRNITPEQEARIIEARFEEGLTREQICRELFDSPITHKGKVSTIITREDARREEREQQKAHKQVTSSLSKKGDDAAESHICVCKCGREDEHPGP